MEKKHKERNYKIDKRGMERWRRNTKKEPLKSMKEIKEMEKNKKERHFLTEERELEKKRKERNL